jgi:hypothetical protein
MRCKNKIHWRPLVHPNKPLCGTKNWIVCLIGRFKLQGKDITCLTCRKLAGQL